jgi:hypothetical protein
LCGEIFKASLSANKQFINEGKYFEWNGGRAVAQLIEALCYKTEGRGFILDKVIVFST